MSLEFHVSFGCKGHGGQCHEAFVYLLRGSIRPHTFVNMPTLQDGTSIFPLMFISDSTTLDKFPSLPSLPSCPTNKKTSSLT